MLAQSLLNAYDPIDQGWENDPQANNIYSWTTAEGILAGHLFVTDLLRHGITFKDWQARSKQLHVKRYRYEFDVAIAFSGRQRIVAEKIASTLKHHGLTVFYDMDYQHELVGEDLASYLQKTYLRKSRHAVAVLSRDFLMSKWSGNWEWRAHHIDPAILLPIVPKMGMPISEDQLAIAEFLTSAGYKPIEPFLLADVIGATEGGNTDILGTLQYLHEPYVMLPDSKIGANIAVGALMLASIPLWIWKYWPRKNN